MVALKSSLHLITLITSFLAYAIIVTLKGYFSAWVAKHMGDPTAEHEGFLSFNPLVHIDPIGAACLLFLGLGWGKTIPIDHRNIPNRAKLTLAYLAGSIAYMILAIIALALLLRIFGTGFIDVARQVPSLNMLGLSILSRAYPGYSSLELSLGLVLIEMVYFGIVLAGIHAILQSFRLVLLWFFPELFYKRELDPIMLIMPLLLLIFVGPVVIHNIWAIVLSFGKYLGYLLGAH